MRIEIDLSKSVEANASRYFEKAKALEAKARAIEAAIERLDKKAIEKESEKNTVVSTVSWSAAKPSWFESFHWSLATDGRLVVAGRSAKDNEELVKKHLGKTDFFLHADIVGAASTIVESKGKPVGREILAEAALLAASCSRAWKNGESQVDVYAVKPDQVSKSAPSGESMGTGAFMIYGTREWFYKTPLSWAIGVQEVSAGKCRLMGGPASLVKAHCRVFVEIRLGTTLVSDASKSLRRLLEQKLGKLPFSLDDYVRRFPAGGVAIVEKS